MPDVSPKAPRIVCTLTGHGLKDPDTAIKQSQGNVVSVEATLEEVRRVCLAQ